ncbi:MAG: ankyrin repeat domain-containing protein [Planctomycetaceae bacterium]|jgi:hypothetical protein|nr:ankyrin repeat domain-containing protein [Planctomycetaceae bacterium]
MYCNNCGNEVVQPDAKFCDNCGCGLGQQVSENENKNHPPITPNTSKFHDPYHTVYWPDSFRLLAKRITLFAFLPLVIAAMLILGMIEPIYFDVDPVEKVIVPCVIFIILGVLTYMVRCILIFVLIYRCWAILREGNPRSSPGMAVGLMFVPLFNFYWMFVATVGLAKDMNQYRNRFGLTHVKPVSVGLPITICILVILSIIPFIGYIVLINELLWILFTFSLARVADAIQEYRLKNNFIAIAPEKLKLAKQQRLWGIKTTVATILVVISTFVVTFGLNACYHVQYVNASLFAANWDDDVVQAQRAIDWGANVNAKNDDGQTPLHKAVRWTGSFTMTKILIDKGADINTKDDDGNTPLHIAAKGTGDDALIIVKYLIKKGAKVNAKNDDDETPQDLAYDDEIREVLKEAEE